MLDVVLDWLKEEVNDSDYIPENVYNNYKNSFPEFNDFSIKLLCIMDLCTERLMLIEGFEKLKIAGSIDPITGDNYHIDSFETEKGDFGEE